MKSEYGRFFCFFLMASLMNLQGVQAAAPSATTIGEAYDLDGNELLYREFYCVSDTRDLLEVSYRNPADQLIARKLLDYSAGATTPSFVQHNLYSSEIIEVALREGKVWMSVLDKETAKPKKLKSESVNDKLPVVIDAGFDQYIRNNWSSLITGENKRFIFPIAKRSKLLELRAQSSNCSYSSNTDQCFTLEFSNMFLRMLTSPIELGYDPESRRLLRYRGISNIGDGKGNGLMVDIRYRYQSGSEMFCNTAEA